MNSFAKFAVAAAAVVLVAFVGIRILPGDGGTGVSPPSQSPSPPPSPIASPRALPAGALTPGAYVMTPFAGPGGTCLLPPQSGCTEPEAENRQDDTFRITVTVPDGWKSPAAAMVWLADKEFTDPDAAGLGFGRGAWLLTDPCQNGKDPDIPVGPTADDFANALAAHPILDTSTPVAVTLGGYSGKYVDLHVPSDYSQCDVYRPFEPGLYAQGPSHEWHLWILDVDGVRVVVQSMDYAATAAQARAELRAIVDSVQIEP